MNASTTPTPSLSPVATSTATSTASPGPTLPDPDSVTPGLAGFLVVFVLALATWLLLRNMTGRLRRMRYREEERLTHESEPPPASDSGREAPPGP